MHRRLYATCTLNLKITAKSPLLVQGAHATTGTATFHEAHDPTDNHKKKYCIPASSLKGVWRSTVEMILRSYAPWLACDPFAEDGESQSCSRKLENKVNPNEAYTASCPACRLFGNTAHAGLLTIDDAWATSDVKQIEPAQIRPNKIGIAVDRFLGMAKKSAIYQYQVLSPGAQFSTHLTLINPELWQIGLLALVFREMAAGRVRIGTGTRRGLGEVDICVNELSIDYAEPIYRVIAEGKPGKVCSTQELMMPRETTNLALSERWLMSDLIETPPTHCSTFAAK